MGVLRFDNRMLRELPGDPDSRNLPRQVSGAAWSAVRATPVPAPRMLAWSREVAASLDLDDAAMRSDELLAAMAGNHLLPGMVSYATCYGGHQFGHWAGQLGDGRAILLGEAINAAGERFELQLKGAGPTPYSRRADGRAVLRSSVREFLCSEAMHHLGVPTTRALCLVGTGEPVMRDMFYDGNPAPEPGAVVCRVAPSFTRFGHFELPASRGDKALLSHWVAFTIKRDFPAIAALNLSPHERIAAWFADICERTAHMVVHWMRVGFVHGVMNTDNMSILGLTIDYGPYGWVDNFDPGWTPNTTDASGRRYCFGNQPEIARWNLERLADALSALMPEQDALDGALMDFDRIYGEEASKAFAGKFGFRQWQDQDSELVGGIFNLMTRAEVDMTEFFRSLAALDIAAPNIDVLRGAFYRDDLLDHYAVQMGDWLTRYADRIAHDAEDSTVRVARMNSFNPRYVLRNYLAQQAIDKAADGDASMIDELLAVLRNPYTEQRGKEAFAAKRPDWARHKAGCSMLSCSS